MVIRRERCNSLQMPAYILSVKNIIGPIMHKTLKTVRKRLEKDGTTVSLAGRLMDFAPPRQNCFCVLRDISGEVQLYFRKDVVGEASYELFKLLDIGDIVGVEGDVFTTHTGETTVRVVTWTLLSKSPASFAGKVSRPDR